MMYIFKEPSLQRIAELKVVTELWKQEDIKIEIAPNIKIQSYYPWSDSPFQDIQPIKNALKNPVIENNLLKKVSALPLPETLKVNLLNLVRPLGSKIKKWWCYHNDLKLTIPKKLCWTPQGAVHYKKTAELIVKDGNLDIETRYAMACMYCFENEIHILWKQIPEERKKRFYFFEEDFPMWPWISRDLRDYRINMVAFWTYIINDKVTELHELILKLSDYSYRSSVYEFAFAWATHGTNRSAIEFFYNKLNCKAKEETSLIYYTENVLRLSLFLSCKMETVIFLLNQRGRERQEEWLKYHAYDVLHNMLYWPYQTFFVETAKKWSRYLMIDDYSNLFHLICDKMKLGKKDYDYEELFLELWQLASVHKDDLLRTYCTLIELYDSQTDLVKYVLNKATDFQKKQLLYIKRFSFEDFSLIVHEQKWNCLKFLLTECITCKKEIINFKRNVIIQFSRKRDAKYRDKLTKALEMVSTVVW